MCQCSRCNRAKGNKDTTDFRAVDRGDADADCPFCPPPILGRAAEDNGTAIPDQYPVGPGHMLVIPHRHTGDYSTMTNQEREDAGDLLRYLRNRIQSEGASVVGFNPMCCPCF